MPEPSIAQVILFGLAFVAACAALSGMARHHWRRHKTAQQKKETSARVDIEEALAGLRDARLDFLRYSALAEERESDAAEYRIRSREAAARIDRLKEYLGREGALHVAEVLQQHELVIPNPPGPVA